MTNSLLFGVVIATAVAVSFWLTVGLSNVFDSISRWRMNRYAEKMGYPTLLDVAKRMESRIKSKMPPFLGGGS